MSVCGVRPFRCSFWQQLLSGAVEGQPLPDVPSLKSIAKAAEFLAQLPPEHGGPIYLPLPDAQQQQEASPSALAAGGAGGGGGGGGGSGWTVRQIVAELLQFQAATLHLYRAWDQQQQHGDDTGGGGGGSGDGGGSGGKSVASAAVASGGAAVGDGGGDGSGSMERTSSIGSSHGGGRARRQATRSVVVQDLAERLIGAAEKSTMTTAEDNDDAEPEPELQPDIMSADAAVDPALASVRALGFPEEAASAALAACGGDVQQAIESLLEAPPQAAQKSKKKGKKKGKKKERKELLLPPAPAAAAVPDVFGEYVEQCVGESAAEADPDRVATW